MQALCIYNKYIECYSVGVRYYWHKYRNVKVRYCRTCFFYDACFVEFRYVLVISWCIPEFLLTKPTTMAVSETVEGKGVSKGGGGIAPEDKCRQKWEKKRRGNGRRVEKMRKSAKFLAFFFLFNLFLTLIMKLFVNGMIISYFLTNQFHAHYFDLFQYLTGTYCCIYCMDQMNEKCKKIHTKNVM